MTWSEGRLLGFDLETTSADPETACIVQYGFTSWEAGLHGGTVQYPVNPGRPIPAEATEVHGITDEHVKTAMSHNQALDVIVATLINANTDGVPLVGMNLAFDLTVIDRHWEKLTGLMTLPERIGNVLDLLVLDKHFDQYRKGKRNLAAIAAHYGTPDFEAHGAGADAEACVVTLLAMCEKYPPLANLDIHTLHEYQVGWRRQQTLSFSKYLVKKGEPALPEWECDWPVRRRPSPEHQRSIEIVDRAARVIAAAEALSPDCWETPRGAVERGDALPQCGECPACVLNAAIADLKAIEYGG